MATRSNIGKLNSDNTVTYIYCHWDGYPAHHGVILTEHYNIPEQVDALLALGDMSELKDTLEACKPYNESPDTEAAIKMLEDYNNNPYIDYFYLFTDEGWKVSDDGGEWVLLKY